MDLFICTYTYIPLRAAPSHKSEMVNQVLFGERFSILETSGTWLRIRTLFDEYTGWIDGEHGGFRSFCEEGHGAVISRPITCTREDNSKIIVAPGSELFNLSDDFCSFTNATEMFRVSTGNGEEFLTVSSVAGIALQFNNSPYLWGGRTPWGIDCSGLVQTVFKINGVPIPRDASSQSECGETVDFFSDAQEGDLVFFSGDSGNITHTGILVSSDRIIHSSGLVRIDRIDHQGIWRDDLGKYTHRLRLIKRIII